MGTESFDAIGPARAGGAGTRRCLNSDANNEHFATRAFEIDASHPDTIRPHPECLTDSHFEMWHTDRACSVAKRAMPSVSKKWSDLPCKAREDMSEEEVLLLDSVRAENIFADGLGDRGGCESLKAPLNPLTGFQGPKLVPTSSGLPDPVAQQALLHPQAQRTPLRSA